MHACKSWCSEERMKKFHFSLDLNKAWSCVLFQHVQHRVIMTKRTGLREKIFIQVSPFQGWECERKYSSNLREEYRRWRLQVDWTDLGVPAQDAVSESTPDLVSVSIAVWEARLPSPRTCVQAAAINPWPRVACALEASNLHSDASDQSLSDRSYRLD